MAEPLLAAALQSQLLPQATLADRFHAALGQVTEKLIRLVAAAPLLAIALLIVLLAVWIGRHAGRRAGSLRLHSGNPYLAGLLQRVLQALIVLAGVLVALDLLGATSLLGAVLGSAGLVGLVFGFAFKDIAENYVAGILLSLRRPFAPGDHIRIDEHEGKVVALTSRATILITFDGNQLQLPNALVFKSVILNFTHNPKRRFEFSVPIDTGESIRKSEQSALAEIAAVEGVLHDPAPSWQVLEFTTTGIGLRFFGWIDQRESDLGKVRSEAIRRVKAAFVRDGILLPKSVQHVVNADASDEGAAARREPRGANVDTSVNRDIDAQLHAERRARDDDDLL